MRTLSCSAARRRLHAFHDRELGVTDQIAVAAHVDRCRACAEVLAEMELVASTLRASTGRRGIMLTHEEVSSFHAGVLNRAKAERDASL